MVLVVESSCLCESNGCNQPILRTAFASDGTVVTWKEHSSIDKIIERLFMVDTHIQSAKEVGPKQQRSLEIDTAPDYYRCIVCGIDLNSIQRLICHLLYVEKPLTILEFKREVDKECSSLGMQFDI
jgi:hypothetical protein